MRPRLLLLWLGLSSGASLVGGCTAGGERPNDSWGGSSGQGGGGPVARIELPFAVTHHFYPTGFMGDGVQGRALLLDTHCTLPEPSGAQGDCFRFRYLPAESTLTGWAGLYFQSEPDNWGSSPGHRVAPGARVISFYAAVDPPGVVVSFLVGGIGTASTPYRDELSESVEIAVGGELERYEIELPETEYERVIGGFGFVITQRAAAGAELVTLELDGIVWR